MLARHSMTQEVLHQFVAALDVQVAQAQELIHELRNLTIPVVICGDFNSDANHGGGVEDTPAVDHFPAAGYTEAWPATHRRKR